MNVTHITNEGRIAQYDRLIRRLRNDPRLWDEDDRVYDILGKALARRTKLRERIPDPSEDVAVMCGIFRGTIEREANARLIAAAPELLEALQFFVDQWDDFSNGDIGEAYTRACDAIAKVNT